MFNLAQHHQEEGGILILSCISVCPCAHILPRWIWEEVMRASLGACPDREAHLSPPILHPAA